MSGSAGPRSVSSATSNACTNVSYRTGARSSGASIRVVDTISVTSSRPAGPAQRARRRRVRVAVVLVVVLCAVAALQAYLASSPAEQLARPIGFASGGELTAVRLGQTAVRPGGRLTVRMYFRGPVP